MTKPSRTDPLSDLRAFDEGVYSGIDLDRLTAFGVRTLIDRDLPVTFENVVVVLYRFFPMKFGLVGYAEYPDAARVNRAILHCFPKYRNYLTGRATTGYRLTHQGEVAAEEAAELLAGRKSRAGKQRRTAARGVADNFMTEVSQSRAFRAFESGERDIDFYDVARILHTSPDAPNELINRNMRQLVIYARETGREDVLKFLDWAQSHFTQLDKSQIAADE